MSSKIVLGIDFGTTKTMVAWVNPATGRAETIQLGNGRNFIPTTVYVEEGGTMRFGEEADDQASLNPMRYCRGFKMKIGSSNPVMMVMEQGQRVFYTARQLTVAFLKYVKHQCEEQAVMQTVQEAVITRPVNFSPAQVEELRSAAEAAGFHKVTFVTEPEAAGYAFCRLIPAEAFQNNALIVDWGGGTLDMAVVSRHGENVSTHAEYTMGDDSMGGELFDVFLWSHISAELARTSNLQLNMEPLEVRHHAKQRLRSEKEALSRTEQRKVFLVLSHGTSSLTVTRSAFETLIHDSVQKAAKHVRTLLSDVQQTSLKPELLLLVGGTAQIPYIQQTLSELTGLPTKKWHYSREAVALGAALWKVPSQSSLQSQAAPTQIDSSLQEKKQYDAPLKTEEFRNGEKYRYGIDGASRDFVKAAEYFSNGYQKRDWNCAYELIECYALGLGVPRSEEMAVSIANEMVAAGCPLGFVTLASASKDGAGMPLDKSKGEAYRQKAVHLCDNPIPGILESIRLIALWSLAVIFEDAPNAEKWARAYHQIETLPLRYSVLGISLVYAAGQSQPVDEKKIKEGCRYIEQGVEHEDPMSLWYSATMSLSESPYSSLNKDVALTRLRRAAMLEPLPSIMGDLLLYEETQDSSSLLRSFLEIAHLGASRISSSTDLNCRMMMRKNNFDAFYRVYEGSVVQAYLQQKKIDALIEQPLVPSVAILNQNSYPISGARMRVCIPEENMEKVIPLTEVIPAEGEVVLSVDDLGIPVRESMSIELLCGGRKSRVDFGSMGSVLNACAWAVYGHNPPPLLMAWTKGFWGGFVLKLLSCDGNLHNVAIHKSNGAHSDQTYTVSDETPIEIGWCEMSDSTGLQENEIFYVTCDGYSPVVGQILTSEDDSSDAGWKTAAKIGAGLLAVALGAS